MNPFFPLSRSDGRHTLAVLFFLFHVAWAIPPDTNGPSVSIRVNGPANEWAITGTGFNPEHVSASAASRPGITAYSQPPTHAKNVINP